MALAHTHADEHYVETRSSGFSSLLWGLLAILAVALFIAYGIPALRGATNTTTGGAGTNITVPERIDVNVNQPAQ